MDFKVLFKSFCVLTALLATVGCDPDGTQSFALLNGTDDTLVVCLDKDTYREKSLTCAPGQSTCFCEITYMDYPLESELEYCINGYWWSFRVYRHDTCLVHWSGKMQHLGDSIHNFYNYDSWTTVATGKSSLLSTYTITPDDLDQSPQPEK